MDYKHEIHSRLERFTVLNGRGNVRDSAQLLFEVIRLMLAREKAEPEEHHEDPAIELLSLETLPAPNADTEVTGDHMVVSSDVLNPVKQTNAPHGLTKFGNPRRIRPPRKKKA